MRQKYIAQLSPTEREHLQRLMAAGAAPARKLAHARILLKSDQVPTGPADNGVRIWSDETLASPR